MLCGINQKTGRCMQVNNKNDTSLFCEENIFDFCLPFD